MKITRLTLHGFTVFADAVFEFAPGVNVLIGENGTGKSHVLKLLYCLSEAARMFAGGEPPEAGTGDIGALVYGKLQSVFQPDGMGSFLASDGGKALVSLEWEHGRIEVTIGPGDAFGVTVGPGRTSLASIKRALFVPPREVLSIFPGFAAAWRRRESAFDRTYVDLCDALDRRRPARC